MSLRLQKFDKPKEQMETAVRIRVLGAGLQGVLKSGNLSTAQAFAADALRDAP